MSDNIYPKREICLLDLHDSIEKKDIDNAIKKNYEITTSKIERRLNVEFKTANIAREVKKFLGNKETTYNGQPFSFSLKGNRFLIDGMLSIPPEEIKAFFSNYGEVNNIYFTKKYFATLASISQAIELVDKVRFVKIDQWRIDIKYAFDHNIGNMNSSNRNFDVKEKNSQSNKSFEVNLKKDLNSGFKKPIIQLGSSNNLATHLSTKPIIQLGNKVGGDRLGSANATKSTNGSIKNVQANISRSSQQLNHQEKPGRRRQRKKHNEQQQQSLATIMNNDITVANSLKTNPTQPLFARGPSSTHVPFNVEHNLNSLNHLDPRSSFFKPINYLEDKMATSQQVHKTTTYYTNKNEIQPTKPVSNTVLNNNVSNLSKVKDPIQSNANIKTNSNQYTFGTVDKANIATTNISTNQAKTTKNSTTQPSKATNIYPSLSAENKVNNAQLTNNLANMNTPQKPKLEKQFSETSPVQLSDTKNSTKTSGCKIS